MNKEYIPNNLSYKLKRLGFDMPSNKYCLVSLGVFGKTQESDYLTTPIKNSDLSGECYTRVLWQQAFQFFLDKGFFYQIYPDNSQFVNEAKEWFFIIHKGTNTTNDVKLYSFDSARLQCLESLISLIEYDKP